MADGQSYLHLFAPAQPDLNWEHPDVRRKFEDVLRFWFDRGVDGFRIDVAHGLAKMPGLPDAGIRPPGSQHIEPRPAWDQDGVHDIYRSWRTTANQYAPQRIFIAEAWVSSNERLARCLRPDGLHTAFQFDFLRTPWRADSGRGAGRGVARPPLLRRRELQGDVVRVAELQNVGRADILDRLVCDI